MSNKQQGCLPMCRKIEYGMGNAGTGFLWGSVATFLLVYCTNVIGVSAALQSATIIEGIKLLYLGLPIIFTVLQTVIYINMRVDANIEKLRK